jgi:hypothetical protein
MEMDFCNWKILGPFLCEDDGKTLDTIDEPSQDFEEL